MNPADEESRRRRINELSYRVLGLCLEVHRTLGPGLLESAYEEALAYEFRTAGIHFERQREQPLHYKGLALDCGYRMDYLIENELVLELKAVSEVLPIHQAQVLTYLKLSERSLGLVVNFNVPLLKDGISRVVCGSLFKEARAATALFVPMALLLCALVALWFKSST
jgi:GxxExxY protein